MVSDGRHASRFRDPWEPNRLPRVAGLCRSCLRQMWTNLPQHHRGGKIAVGGDGVHCEPCLRYIRETGRNPQDKPGNSAEVIASERPEDDQWWRDPDLIRCFGVGGGAFEPDPLPDDDQATDDRVGALELRRYVAAFVCGACPVAFECRQAARVHGYEGMWGGRFYARTWWMDPLTGMRGPTMHTREPIRSKMVAALGAAGYDEDGEPR